MHFNANQKILHLVKEAATDDLKLALRGECMSPNLQNGSDIKVRNTGFYWPGDILVYRDKQDKLLAHRLLGYYRHQGEWRS